MFKIYAVFLKVFTIIFILNNATSYASDKSYVYKYKSKNGITSFSDIQPLNSYFQTIKVSCYACKLNSQINWHKSKLYLTKYASYINKAAIMNDIDPAFVRAIIHAESHFDVNAISKQGAQGLMQLMPRTAKALGVNNPFIAQQNINGGVKHLALLLKKYKGNSQLASAAYNAGESTINRYAGIPPYQETEIYVERVDILYQRYARQLPPK